MNDPEGTNTKAAASDAPQSAGQPGVSTSQVAPDADTYPKYRLRFQGTLVEPKLVTGPHTIALLGAHTRVVLSVSRNPTDPGVPDLNITVTEGP